MQTPGVSRYAFLPRQYTTVLQASKTHTHTCIANPLCPHERIAIFDIIKHGRNSAVHAYKPNTESVLFVGMRMRLFFLCTLAHTHVADIAGVWRTRVANI